MKYFRADEVINLLATEYYTYKQVGIIEIEDCKAAAEFNTKHLPTIEISEDCISKHDIWKIIEDNAYWVRYNENSTEKGMTLTGINQALNECPPVIPTVSEDCIYTYCSRCGMRVVVDAPSVVPTTEQSSMVGEWIELAYGGIYTCSNCKVPRISSELKPDYKFCPNCGAKMKGAE